VSRGVHGVFSWLFDMEVVPEGRITALRPQSRQARVKVYLDGRYAFSLAESVAAALQVGQVLTAAQVRALQEADTRARAWQDAARLLAVRPRSEAEVRQRLQRRGYAHDIVEATVERLRTLGWLDDAAFARQWVENRLAFRPRGRARLRAELRQKGIAPALIEAALRDLDETTLALEAGRKVLPRYQGLPWPVFARRLSGYLARRGFPPDVVRQVVQQLWQTSRHSSDPELDSGQGAEAW